MLVVPEWTEYTGTECSVHTGIISGFNTVPEVFYSECRKFCNKFDVLKYFRLAHKFNVLKTIGNKNSEIFTEFLRLVFLKNCFSTLFKILKIAT